MIYFDNAATGGKKPIAVKLAVAKSLIKPANAGRSGHKLSVTYSKKLYDARAFLCSMFDGAAFERVIFTKNCTEALNLAINGIPNGSNVVTTELEHNSVLRPLHERARLNQINLRIAACNKDGSLSNDSVYALIDQNTDALVITLASNVTGYAPDVEAIRSKLPERALLICDGAQAGGHFTVSMRRAKIDALCLAGHKGLYALQGAGALILSERFTPPPIMRGGTGSESLNLEVPNYLPDGLESGTLSYPCIRSLHEGARHAQTRMYKNRVKLYGLSAYLYERLAKLAYVTPYAKPNASGIISFAVKNYESERLAYTLSEKYNIAVRGGYHCAPLVHKAIGSNGLVRVSLSPYNTKKQINKLINALDKSIADAKA